MSNLDPIFDQVFSQQLGDRRKYTGEKISNIINSVRLDLDDYLLILEAFAGRVKDRELVECEPELEEPLRTLWKAYEEMEEAVGRIEARQYEPDESERRSDE